VYSLDFLPEFNNWDTTLPVALFNARAEKKEERGGMSRHDDQQRCPTKL
jgi:hypothetical protein